MTYYVYLLKSVQFNRYYIGCTQCVELRLKKHNYGGSTYTRKFKPWKVVYTEQYKTKSESLKRERYLKSAKGYLELIEIKKTVGGVA